MINVCLNCKATREYPDGRIIAKCPRCDSDRISVCASAASKDELDEMLIRAIDGTLADYLLGYKP